MGKVSRQPSSAVLRIADVVLTKAELETALQAKPDRYEPATSGTARYAQLDVPMESGWNAVIDYMNSVGPRLSTFRKSQRIGATTIDFAVAFLDDAVTLSVDIPSGVAETIGRHGIDVELSIYLTS